MRKLTWAVLSYALAVFAMHYLKLDPSIGIVCVICCALMAVGAFLFRGNIRTGIIIVSLFAAFGVIRYDLHYDHTVRQFEDYIGSECRITAELCEYPVIYEDSVKYTVKLDTDLLPKEKAIIYDYTSTASCLRPGDRFRATVRLNSAVISSGEETDTYVSKGVYVRGYVVDEVRVISTESKVIYIPLYFAETIRSTLAEFLPRETAAFLSALMTGDKTELYEEAALSHTLNKAGLSHVVAVSGMHVSFVVAMAMMLFGQRFGWSASLILVMLFAVMTGMTPSVLRAVFMQTLFLIAPVLRREADGITSIGFALLILLIHNPFAISSLSLQLSFLAMLGIILVTPCASAWFDEKCPFTNDRAVKVYRFIYVSLSSSLGATIFTAPLCAYHFGNISVLAPLTNLLILWIVPICFAGGFLLCVISILPAVAGIVAAAVNFCVSFVFVVSKWIAALPIAAVYLPKQMMFAWFVIVYGVIGVMFLFKKKGMYRPLVPLMVAVTGLVLCAFTVQRTYERGMTVSAIDVGQGQCIAVLDGESTVLADCGGDYDSGETAAQWLYSRGRNEVDVLVISHFDRDHVNGVIDLMHRIPVKRIIYCGNVVSDDTLSFFNELTALSEKTHTELVPVNTESELALGALRMRLKAVGGDIPNAGLITHLQSRGYELLVMGDADFDGEEQLLRCPWLYEVECLVVGHHGSASSTGDALLNHICPQSAIISCGYNRYGHPSEEVLNRLMKKNVIIYRTDQMGTIEIKVR